MTRLLVSDAHTTEDYTSYGAPSPELVIAHTNLYWKYQTAPGRTAGTVTTAEVDFGGAFRPRPNAPLMPSMVNWAASAASRMPKTLVTMAASVALISWLTRAAIRKTIERQNEVDR